MNKKYINKVKQRLIDNGFLKIEDDQCVLYEYDPKLKSQYRKIHSFYNSDWNFQLEVLRFDKIEGLQRLKIIKTYPSLKKYFWVDIKNFIKYWKIEISKKQCKRNPQQWDRMSFEELAEVTI